MDQIILKAYKPQKNPKMGVCPLEDETGNTYTGQGEAGYFELLTEKDKKGLLTIVKPTTRVRVTDGYRLDPDNPMDKITWAWMQKHPYLDLTRQVNPDKEKIFYVFNPEKEATIKVTKSKRVTKVMNEVYDKMNIVEKRSFAEALGLGDSSGLSEIEVENYLEIQTADSLDKMEAILEGRKEGKGDSKMNALKMYHAATNAQIITKESGGWLKYGGAEGVTLGRTEDDVIARLLHTDFKETAFAIQTDLDNLK